MRGKEIQAYHMADLERVLEGNNGRGKLIVVDGVFSMEGDIVDLPAVVKIARNTKPDDV